MALCNLGELRGRPALVEAIREMHEAYPDLKASLKHMIGEGDMVAAHWSATGTHRQPYRGAAPSAERVTGEGITLYRVADGKIVEMWGFPHTTTYGSPHEILRRQRASS